MAHSCGSGGADDAADIARVSNLVQDDRANALVLRERQHNWRRWQSRDHHDARRGLGVCHKGKVPFCELEDRYSHAPHGTSQVASAIGGIKKMGSDEHRFRLYAARQRIFDKANALEQKLSEASSTLWRAQCSRTVDGGVGDRIRAGELAALRRASRIFALTRRAGPLRPRQAW